MDEDVTMKTTLLPAGMLPELLEVAIKNRINIQAVFEAAQIDADTIGRPDRFIRLEQLDALLEAAFRLSNNPYLGLAVGRDNHHGKLDLLGNLLATANTLGDGLRTLLEYKDILVPYLQFALHTGETRARLDVYPDTRLKFAYTRPHAELVMASLVAVGRSLLSNDLPLLRVGFMHEQPGDLSLYYEVFNCELEFGADVNYIEVDSALLDTPLTSAYPQYHERLRALADDTLRRIARAQGVSGQVMDLLERRLGGDDTSIESVAACMNMTPRTLQRRLAQEETTFAHLRDQLRHQRACKLLGDQRVDMGAIAEQLGFSDTANFYHAFKRWEGCAPGEYRRLHRAPAH